MKKLIILFLSVLVFANNINFVNPFESNVSSQNNKTFVNKTPEYKEKNETNVTETNISTRIIESNSTLSGKQNIQTESFDDSFKSLTPDIKLAIVINKNFFRKYLPSIINSINAYFLYKNTNFTIKVFDENNLSEAINSYKYILFYAVNPEDVYLLNNYKNNNFYIPIINKNDVNASELNNSNIYFGGIDYKNQINKLSSFIQNRENIVVINSNTYISNKLYNLEKREFNITAMNYPYINYGDLNNSYIFFNTAANKTAQILSNINYKNIQPILELSTQINYDPLLIELTQQEDVQKLIIANSILNIPDILEDYNELLGSDIKFNWLNYTSNVLANKIYNTVINGDEFYLNDFRSYIFNNQVNYKTTLYQIIDNSFRKLY